jgi:hypothetical protein
VVSIITELAATGLPMFISVQIENKAGSIVIVLFQLVVSTDIQLLRVSVPL